MEGSAPNPQPLGEGQGQSHPPAPQSQAGALLIPADPKPSSARADVVKVATPNVSHGIWVPAPELGLTEPKQSGRQVPYLPTPQPGKVLGTRGCPGAA